MKHTLHAAYERGKGWVKNARKFVHDHPLLMATGGLVGGSLYAAGEVASGPTLPARHNEPRHLGMPAHTLRREAVASSNTFSDRPVLLGNRGIK